MEKVFGFTIQKKGKGLARAGVIETAHGKILTPAFAAVGTKASVKSLTPVEIKDVGISVVLANTYHLYLEPGEKIVEAAGGLGKFMNWPGPTMTDSGGFQVFSLGAAFGRRQSKISFSKKSNATPRQKPVHSDVLENIRMGMADSGEGGKTTNTLVKIDEDGVDFLSYKDGSKHRFTPERSIQIQQSIGADIIFAFDECPSPSAPYEYQREAMERTHRWALRSLAEHKRARRGLARASRKKMRKGEQALFGIVQGGRYGDLRKESAKAVGAMDFDGFGIGGSFEKEDIESAVSWVNEILPPEKPRHLLGIGDPLDIWGAVENGIDTFDCVAPTREARTGSLYTRAGRVNITNAKFVKDFSPLEEHCDCYTCANFSRSYLAHLYRTKEILASTLGTIHNLRFFTKLMGEIREGVLADKFEDFRADFARKYSTR